MNSSASSGEAAILNFKAGIVRNSGEVLEVVQVFVAAGSQFVRLQIFEIDEEDIRGSQQHICPARDIQRGGRSVIVRIL